MPFKLSCMGTGKCSLDIRDKRMVDAALDSMARLFGHISGEAKMC